MRALALLSLFCLVSIFSGCSKEKDYTYWSDKMNEKSKEIETLVYSVPCSDIDEFQPMLAGIYYPVHPTVKERFLQLASEYREYYNKWYATNPQSPVIHPIDPFPPIDKVCRDGKPKLIYPKDLGLDEVKQAIDQYLSKLRDLSKDTPCNNPEDWVVYSFRLECCPEFIPVHKELYREHYYSLGQPLYALFERMHELDKTECDVPCNTPEQHIVCKDGKAVVEAKRN